VSVLPPNTATAVNVNFAPPEVLMAIVPGLQLGQARQIAIQIKSTPLDDTKKFSDLLKTTMGTIPSTTMNISVISQYFMVTGYATQGDGFSAVHALLFRNDYWATQIRKSLQ
jgi:general secretion pathway protein K